MSSSFNHIWEIKEPNGHLIIFKLSELTIRFEILEEGAYDPEEKQGEQSISDFVNKPLPWMERYPGLHEEISDRIRKYKLL